MAARQGQHGIFENFRFRFQLMGHAFFCYPSIWKTVGKRMEDDAWGSWI